jgi:hypothetical protein
MTSAPSTESRGEEQLTFLLEDFPAKTSVLRVKAQELAESVQAYGRNMRDSLKRYNLDLSLPKTHLCFALGDLELSSKTSPRWGIMLDGELSELGLSVRPIKETECGFSHTAQIWRSPAASEPGVTIERLETKTGEPVGSMCRHYDKYTGRNCQIGLSQQVKAKQNWPTPRSCSAMAAAITPESAHNPKRFPNLETIVGRATWPTPTCQETEHPDAILTETGRRLSKNGKTSHSLNLADTVKLGGIQTQQKAQLNPSWVEWLMGWPIGYTDLKPLETDKFRNVQQWHSMFSHEA